jgi:hypothetical protein
MKDFAEFKTFGARCIVLGKGPSFERWDSRQAEFSDFVVGVNQAAQFSEVDACVVSHVEPAVEVFRAKPECPIVTPYFPIFGWTQETDMRADQYKDLEGADLYGYNAYWQGKNLVGDSAVVGGSGTTVHHLVHLMMRKGFKHFVFYGVDGGRKAYGKQYYASEFRLDDKRYFQTGKIPTDYDSFWPYLFQLRRSNGLTYEFI